MLYPSPRSGPAGSAFDTCGARRFRPRTPARRVKRDEQVIHRSASRCGARLARLDNDGSIPATAAGAGIAAMMGMFCVEEPQFRDT